MKRLLILILAILIPIIGFSQETLKEKFQKEKAHYTELANQTGFTFKGTQAWGDKFKNPKYQYWTNWLTVENGGGEINEFLAQVINDNDSLLLRKIKQLAVMKRSTLRNESNVAIDEYKTSASNETDISTESMDKMYEYRSLQNSHQRLKDLTEFEVLATWDGVTVMNGFDAFNGLLVETLNANISLIRNQYRKAVQDAFIVKRSELRQEADSLIIEIDK